MNYIHHLRSFFFKAAMDDRLNPTHISLYMAIFQFWNSGYFQNPITISRQELMRISKISAKATYHKCIKELAEFGYIEYIPSYHPLKGSLVYLFEFQSGTRLNFEPYQTKIETSSEQALVPYIYKNNINNNIDIEETILNNGLVEKLSNDNAFSKKIGEAFAPTIENDQNKSNRFVPPTLEEISNFFLEQKSTELDAQKFFHHYQSNGWLIGGRLPMIDWTAAAKKWILNIPQFSQAQIVGSKQLEPGVLKVTTDKNYNEPL